ncbi:DUF3175 domain-containing protein [Methylocystis heyeri]|uniref:DUF3175 domain-containing protein n=1 Tax=Methylocystis heyeri TaxID=391905 RepID=A0A6B8KLD5_9HYPH|nr:DUF3175 domain-containing protein [Methylocystis heyeri]QGM47463.1 DUF3175 domain-containing protein [Methylocystis heyeri]
MKRNSKAPSSGPRSKDARSGEAYWSGEVTRKSNALDLDAGVFALDEPEKIAASLKKSAEASARRKSPPFRSAMSMLTFYLNRAGRNLPQERKEILERAKTELRKQFGRLPEG